MKKNKEENSSLAMKRSTVLRLKSLKTRLGYSSLESAVVALMDARDKLGWDAADLLIIAKYGRLPEIVSGEARNDEEMREKLGLQNAKKTSESFIEAGPKIHGSVAKRFAGTVDIRDLNKKKKDGEK